jgi:hypothetical protein
MENSGIQTQFFWWRCTIIKKFVVLSTLGSEISFNENYQKGNIILVFPIILL